MMKKWGICLLLAGLFLGACKNDDDINELPQDEQNQVDDQAILAYLEDHYFEPERGLIKKYSDDNEEDDNYPSLKSLGTKLNSGVWVIARPGVPAEGPGVTNNLTDSLLISYDSKMFKATNQDLSEGEKSYEPYFGSFFNTINSTGQAAWDPYFYYTHITPEMDGNNVNQSHFMIEGFVEGIKHFQSTQTSGADLYNFQGAVIVPSRAAYGRDFMYSGGVLRNDTYRDTSFIFNFEIHKVIPRN